VALRLTAAKQLSIATGLYRPARWLARTLRASESRAFRADIALYDSFLSSGDLCFDVGANVGDKSEAMLQLGAHVVAFEPNPLVVPELRARCAQHPRWTLVEAALGSAAAISTFYAQREHSQSSLARGWENGEVIGSFRVPVVTLDAAIRSFGCPKYCKIDVEGWEGEVLLGLSQPIPLLSFEFHLDADGVRKAKSCLERLSEFGTSHVNVIPAERSTFHFNDWIPLEAFIKGFPENLDPWPGNPYGDMFVKNG
jgi:FkbM family methyltransferase